MEIAEANAVPLPELNPTECFEQLSSANGYLARRSGEGFDPIVSALALDVGWNPPPRLAEVLRLTAGPMGWRGEIPPVNPASTYQAVAVRHALGVRDRDAQVIPLAAEWLAELAGRLARPEELRQRLHSAQYVVLLARELDLPVGEVGDALKRLLANPDVADWEPYDFVFLLRLANLLEVEIPNAFGTAAQGAILAFPPETINDLTSLVILNQAFPSPQTAERIAEAATLLEVGDGLFATSIRFDVPEVRATATGLYATGRLTAAGPEALTAFITNEGVSQTPPRSDLPVFVSIQTIYTGFVLAGKIRSDRWLV